MIERLRLISDKRTDNGIDIFEFIFSDIDASTRTDKNFLIFFVSMRRVVKIFYRLATVFTGITAIAYIGSSS